MHPRLEHTLRYILSQNIILFPKRTYQNFNYIAFIHWFNGLLDLLPYEGKTGACLVNHGVPVTMYHKVLGILWQRAGEQ